MNARLVFVNYSFKNKNGIEQIEEYVQTKIQLVQL